jgi:methionyl-tRNA formyltransferase
MRIVVSAGFNRSLPAVILADRALRMGHEVVGIVVATGGLRKRGLDMLRRQGLRGLWAGARKFVTGSEASQSANPIQQLAAECGVAGRSLSAWAEANQVPFLRAKSLNAARVGEFVQQHQGEALVYAGGGIIRQPLIAAFGGRVINGHCGPLPEIRGIHAIEWATLLGCPLEVTVHLIDEGIDTGPVLARRAVQVEHPASVEQLRLAAVAASIEGIVEQLSQLTQAESLNSVSQAQTARYRQCYRLAPALSEILQARLQRWTQARRSVHECH